MAHAAMAALFVTCSPEVFRLTISPAPPAGAFPAAAALPVRRRPLLWLLAIVLVLQLAGAARHDHEFASKAQHCVSCMAHAQPHAPPPGAALRAVPSTPHVLHTVPAAAALRAGASTPDYLLPPPHAPPGFLLAARAAAVQALRPRPVLAVPTHIQQQET